MQMVDMITRAGWLARMGGDALMRKDWSPTWRFRGRGRRWLVRPLEGGVLYLRARFGNEGRADHLVAPRAISDLQTRLSPLSG